MPHDLSPHRVAIYYAPDPQSIWWRTGSEWLGRCADTGRALPQPSINGMASDSFAQLTAEPRRYGWHATLKAPFRLASGQSLATVRAGVHLLCQGLKPFDLAPLQVSCLGHFLALRPKHIQPELMQLAADCVQKLQYLASPLSDKELARRRLSPLTAEQDALLQAWGYPYVLQHFQFHLSLTGNINTLPPETLAALLEAAALRFHPWPECRIDRLSIFAEPAPGEDFQLLEQIRFQP